MFAISYQSYWLDTDSETGRMGDRRGDFALLVDGFNYLELIELLRVQHNYYFLLWSLKNWNKKNGIYDHLFIIFHNINHLELVEVRLHYHIQ